MTKWSIKILLRLIYVPFGLLGFMLMALSILGHIPIWIITGKDSFDVANKIDRLMEETLRKIERL